MVTNNVRIALLAVVVVTMTVAPIAAGSAQVATHAPPAATGQSGGDGAARTSTCAATPPDDLADPDSDVLGWENGTWYSEQIAVDQTDGLNASELNATLARTQARVEYVRCLEFERAVPVNVISRAEFRDTQLNRSVAPALRVFDNAKFEALFLINESADSIAVQNRNRGTSVLGFYDPRNDTIVLVSENRSTLRVDEVTLAHELVHALQDARYNLSSGPFGEKIRDDANAVDGVVEGDASYVDFRYARQCERGAWNGTCLSQQRGADDGLANIGVYFLKFQPYSDGPAFVRLLYEAGGWDAVNGVYTDPPTSTEQVIQPERYGTDDPANVSLDDTATENWTRVRPPDRPDYASLGQAGLASMLVYPTYHSRGQTQIVPASAFLNLNESGNVSEFDPLNYDVNYTRGWDGDRLHVYRRGNETAYVWRIAWDSPQDARKFVAGYGRVLRYWGGERVAPGVWVIEDGGFADAFRVSVEGTNVTIVNAPTREDLSTVRPAAGDGNLTLNVSTGGNSSVGAAG